MNRIVLLFLLFVVSSLSFAQSTFEVISGYPLNNDCKVPALSEFQINFNSGVNISTVSSNTIKLIGHQSGFHDFSTSVGNNGQKLTIKNNEQFFAGESVTLIITSNLTNILGQKLSKSSTFNYTVRTLSSKGSFIKVKEFSVGSRPETITGADINNDGRIDLIVLNIYSYDVSILTNMGNLDFFETQRIPVGYLPQSVQMGVIDIGQDNDLDIIISNRMENSISVLTNNGNGMFSSSKINNVGSQPIAISSSDLDGDGFEDFVIANNGNGNANTVIIYLNTGTGSFNRFNELTTDTGPHFVLINDIDNDYDNDLVVVNYHGNSINVFKNDGYGQFNRFSSVGTGANPRTASLVDVNNDGFIDIALPCSGIYNLQIFLNDRDGNYSLYQDQIVGPFPPAISSGDVDGDGDIDLATLLINQNKVVILKNNEGTFDILEDQNTNEYPYGLNFLDIDNDGNLELIVSNILSDNIIIYENEIIVDSTPPVITSTVPQLNLWPPNNKYENLSLDKFGLKVSDNLDQSLDLKDIFIQKVTIDEYGSLKDVNIIDYQTVLLKRTRNGNGNGRVYKLFLGVIDNAGNLGTTVVRVVVPHDMSKDVIDDGELILVNGFDHATSTHLALNKDNSKKTDSGLPNNFNFFQNYPNPFNPTTQISFDIPKQTYVELKVYDVLGKEVSVLTSRQHSPGKYNYTFDAASLPSGIYFYHINAGEFQQTRKMLLLK